MRRRLPSWRTRYTVRDASRRRRASAPWPTWPPSAIACGTPAFRARSQPGEVGRRAGAGVRDVLGRYEQPPAIRIDVGMEGELRPVERSADELGTFTQRAIAVVGVVCRDDHGHGLEGLERAARATPAQLDVDLRAVLAAGAVRVREVLGRPDGGEEAIWSERTRGRRHVGALLSSRGGRLVVVVGGRIRDVRATRSAPQQDAEDCHPSSVCHPDILPFEGPACRATTPDLE